MFRCSYTIFRDITVGSAKVTKILNDKIQGDQKVSVHPMITIQKITSNFPSVPPPGSRHLLTCQTVFSKTVFSIA